MYFKGLFFVDFDFWERIVLFNIFFLVFCLDFWLFIILFVVLLFKILLVFWEVLVINGVGVDMVDVEFGKWLLVFFFFVDFDGILFKVVFLSLISLVVEFLIIFVFVLFN